MMYEKDHSCCERASAEPQFEGQTKTKLGNNEVESIINSAVGEFLGKYLEEHPKSQSYCAEGVLAAEARTAAQKQSTSP